MPIPLMAALGAVSILEEIDQFLPLSDIISGTIETGLDVIGSIASAPLKFSESVASSIKPLSPSAVSAAAGLSEYEEEPEETYETEYEEYKEPEEYEEEEYEEEEYEEEEYEEEELIVPPAPPNIEAIGENVLQVKPQKEWVADVKAETYNVMREQMLEQLPVIVPIKPLTPSLIGRPAREAKAGDIFLTADFNHWVRASGSFTPSGALLVFDTERGDERNYISGDALIIAIK